MNDHMIDIGANLMNKAFRGELSRILERARAQAVGRIIVTGTSVSASRAARDLSRKHPAELLSTAGIHPHHAKEFDSESVLELRELLADDRVVSVGECGLDYNRDFSPRETQRACFEAQLELARETMLPVFLHERDTHEDFVRIWDAHPGLKGVVHCFTGNEKQLDAYLERDLYIGVTGFVCDPRRGKTVRGLLTKIPSNRLMIETDAPFMLPPAASLRVKRRNEPSFLGYVAQEVAEASGRSLEEVIAQTSQVARGFFAFRSENA